ncbi:MAG: apolipoprotein N-acyltransferase [Leptolyngbyaceae cyanobacterium bins.59]|nr:apolipoprotein N-acyltransferase [Leptolyngbyaceae cyanobacterium bins.59]
MSLLKILRSTPFVPVLIGGILMGLTPAPTHLWPLAWIALVPLWVVILSPISSENTKFRTMWAVWLGATWGIGYHGLALAWITGVHPMTWMGVPWLASLAIALFCWAFITMWGAILVGGWAWGMVVLHRLFLTPSSNSQSPETRKFASLRSLIRVLLGIALWCGLESLWNQGALWWTSLSYTQSPNNLIILHLGRLAGPSTVTAALVAVNGVLAEGWLQGHGEHRAKTWGGLRRGYGIGAIGLLLGFHLLGFSLYRQPLLSSPETTLRIGIIQGNVPNTIKLYPEGWRRAIEGYTAGYEVLAMRGVDAVLTPETALPFLWQEWGSQERSQAPTFYQAVMDRGVTAWVGALGKRDDRYTNSLFTMTGDGKLLSRYDKAKLVPLGEYIPFESILGRFIDRLSPLDAQLAPGSLDQTFETPWGRAIVAICYESAFADLFRRQAAAGGQFILSPSNDAHYSATMPAQHHAQDVMRAIETDRWAVRAVNTGYSAVVDPHGHTLWKSQLNTYELHEATIDRRQTRTLYVQWGDWLTPLLIVLSGMTCFFSREHDHRVQ